MKGLFITFEGVDGCGKTTQIEILQKKLENIGYDVVLTREPGGTKISEEIRDIILNIHNDGMSYVCEMMLYAAARAQLVKEVIQPAREEGKIVLCDRFVDSSYVYQGIARGIGIDVVREINEIALTGVYPDATVFFDISPEEAKRRRVGDDDRIEREKMEFHRKVYEGYLSIAKIFPDRIHLIDASKSIEEVEDRVFECVKKILEE